MIDKSVKFARKTPHQSYKEPHSLKFSGELLDKAYESTEKLVALNLAVAKIYHTTIASDGWSQSWILWRAAAFLKSVDHCTDHMAERGKKDTAHIASFCRERICAEDVGNCGMCSTPLGDEVPPYAMVLPMHRNPQLPNSIRIKW